MADKQDAKALAVTLAAGLEKDLGAVSAYAIAVEHGYEGTEEEWAAQMQKALNSADESAASAQAAKDSADAAAQSVKDAQSAAGEATNAAQEVVTQAQALVDEAKNAAQNAAEEAAQAAASQSAAAQSAYSAEQAATNAAQEVVTQVQTQIDQKVTDAVTKQKNMVFVDKQIGTTITEEQSAAIKAGTFDNLNVGNYWLSGGIKYRIAGFDIFYKCGDNPETGHHVVVVPDRCIKTSDGFTTHWMQDTDTTDGGYAGSKMYKETLPNVILPIIEGVFGSHILQHREILSNATSEGLASGFSWYDRKVDLMCEHMLYGASVWGNGKRNVGIGTRQLPLFRMAYNLIHANRDNFWLRDVVSSTAFAVCSGYGYADYDRASAVWAGVRPYFLLQ